MTAAHCILVHAVKRMMPIQLNGYPLFVQELQESGMLDRIVLSLPVGFAGGIVTFGHRSRSRGLHDQELQASSLFRTGPYPFVW